MNAKKSLFLLLGLCIALASVVRAEVDDSEGDGVTVEDENVSIRILAEDKSSRDNE